MTLDRLCVFWLINGFRGQARGQGARNCHDRRGNHGCLPVNEGGSRATYVESAEGEVEGRKPRKGERGWQLARKSTRGKPRGWRLRWAMAGGPMIAGMGPFHLGLT